MLRRVVLMVGACLLAAAGVWGQTASAPQSGVGGVGLLAVPEAGLQGQARGMIRKLFEKEYAKTAAADRRALARVLLAQARDTADDAAARYVALAESADLAAGAGDAGTAVAAVDEIAGHYSVNGLELRRAALVRAGGAATAAGDCETVMRLALETADRAAAADAFDAVVPLVNLAEGAANKTRELKVVASIQVRLADFRGLVAEYGQVKGALGQLEREPGDAAAHLTIGRFYALHKGQWGLGLSHLAQGSDAELAELARRELALPTDGLLQTAVGDGWWEYAEKSSGVTRAAVSAHAAEWYKKAQETIKGITLARIQSRIDAGTAADVPKTVAGAGAMELLPLIDVAKDGAAGQWARGAEGVTCASGAYACLHLPWAPAEEYDLTASFTRVEDDGSIALLLAAQKRSFEFVLDVKGEARFEQVGGKIAKDNPTVVPVAVSNGRRYTLTVEVRRDHVRAILDGRTLVEWKTDLKDLTRYSVWKLGDTTLCGIGANGAKVTFHAVEMVEVTGKGRGTR